MSARRVPASFRGVAFEVEDEGQTGGRRAEGFEFPRRDTPSSQDLGRRQRTYSLSAYVYGDDVDAQRARLLEALERPGVGILIHPTYGALSVRCTNYTATNSLADSRSTRFALEFMEAGDNATPTASVDPTARLSAAADETLDAAAAAYANNLAVTSQVDGVTAGALADIRSTTAAIRSSTNEGPLASALDTAVDIAVALDELDEAAATLLLAPETYAAQIQTALALVTSSAVAEALTSDAGAETPALPGTPAPSEITTRANTEEIRRLYMHSALAVHAVALSQSLAAVASDTAAPVDENLLSRAGAMAALTLLLRRIDAERQLDLDDETGDALYRLRQAAESEVLSRVEALPRVQTIIYETPVDWLSESYRLYGSTERADRLWRLNGGGHPGFVFGEQLVEVAQ